MSQGRRERCATCGCVEEHWLTVREVAKALRVTARTVRNLIASGELEAMRVGEVWRIRHSGLDEYVKRHDAP